MKNYTVSGVLASKRWFATDLLTVRWGVLIGNTMVYYIDKYGCVHTSKEMCVAANRS
jgi:hypothetical protein